MAFNVIRSICFLLVVAELSGEMIELSLVYTRNFGTPADGYSKSVVFVNGIWPGPDIIATAGDQLVVHVTNNLSSSESFTVHWHGKWHSCG